MNYERLKLENQLCFPLYACAKEVVRKYKPHLDEIGLTYTQFITMLVLWERKSINVKQLGEHLYLDSGTLTPLLKKLEGQGLVIRKRMVEDERNLIVQLTTKGEELKDKAAGIPDKVGKCIGLTTNECKVLYGLLYKILENSHEEIIE